MKRNEGKYNKIIHNLYEGGELSEKLYRRKMKMGGLK